MVHESIEFTVVTRDMELPRDGTALTRTFLIDHDGAWDVVTISPRAGADLVTVLGTLDNGVLTATFPATAIGGRWALRLDGQERMAGVVRVRPDRWVDADDQPWTITLVEDGAPIEVTVVGGGGGGAAPPHFGAEPPDPEDTPWWVNTGDGSLNLWYPESEAWVEQNPAAPVQSVNGKTGAVSLNAADVGADPAGSAAAVMMAVATGYQPLDPDLTAIADLSTTPFGRSLLTLASAAAARTAIGVPSAPAYMPGVWSTPSLGPLTDTAVARDAEYMIPLDLRAPASIDGIGVLTVGTAGSSGAVVRVGIRADDGFGVPGALVIDGGTAAVDATSTFCFKAFTATALTAGRWYLCVAVQNSTVNPVLRCAANSGGMDIMSNTSTSGLPARNNRDLVNSFRSGGSAAGAFNATEPSNTWGSTSATVTPAVWWRAA